MPSGRLEGRCEVEELKVERSCGKRQRRGTETAEVRRESQHPPPPCFFVSAHSKGVTASICVSADSKELKVAVFSMSCGRLVSAHSKGVSDLWLVTCEPWQAGRRTT